MTRTSADYDARALALPVDLPPEEQRRTSLNTQAQPAWRRRSSSLASSAGRRRSGGTLWRMRNNAAKLQRHGLKLYKRLTPLQRVLLVLAGLISFVLGILFLVYNEHIFKYWLAPVAKKWRDIPAGWLILWSMTFVVSFPPLIGYSTCVTLAGFVYGFPNGWFIVASATVIGSTASFLATRMVMHRFVSRLIANDPRFAALALTLKHDGIKLLIMIRLCPLPYSLSNGAIATFPTVHWAAFMLAGAIASPKLLLHVFVGAKIGELAEKGEQMDGKTKAISYVSIIIGLVAGAVTGYIMYSQTKKRAAELEQQEREGARHRTADEIAREYSDDPEAGLAAEVLREEEDDISLHNDVADLGGHYRDESPSGESEEEGYDDDAPDVVFDVGDGESTEEDRK
ncbi:Monooxygenase FAD-binding protein [Lasiodiplodia theobromae]|uniref:Golgi apparatus membrane protein TVP38 n=1 Tax=Lasiodiplodia theobromae TaxID=45133 RepID=A0A5N5DJ43_9PEZI|nr:Tlg2-vesicle protein [Lasiodiplodia theobromae]KAB2577903.1 Golgi apparatus membrane protein tvp38 [Lasiodiplodia theobromae]KAF4538455.1 Tlg2-vesicle protein [Lasiodiplodia theobromae]KAF9633555.1 Monooxygenase FAD-binding protein [Lasiodiplodia theobromae]